MNEGLLAASILFDRACEQGKIEWTDRRAREARSSGDFSFFIRLLQGESKERVKHAKQRRPNSASSNIPNGSRK
jgi:hypothetical protein